ncbi:thyroid adenoma-associated protein homolog [Phymastichus coffea]|uniref:thyroid adenoma-associated protein homolog n=1 Tax=Phymastichus coffea TaxID=108790 RepID=UPI00273AB54F|nr:thyroid adenoma-associated protein homolog [Phymastichus coffea]
MNEIMKRDIELVQSLKKSKKDGSLDKLDDPAIETYKWRNTVEYQTLEHWLTCDNEELRLHTFELLTISKKSTLLFTAAELNLIFIFLRCNMKEKIEFVPLAKKVLKRLEDSYVVLKRQLNNEKKVKELQKQHPNIHINVKKLSNVQNGIEYYKKFVSSLHELCFMNLYPSAVNARRKSSLQILCLMDEYLCEDLKGSLWELSQFEILFDCLLQDTYETNKNMAFQLIKSSKLVETFFDTKEKLLELIHVAIELGNSIRPLGSITAAYMLKISMLLPDIQKVLVELTEFEKTENAQEKTTFYMILLLKMNLEKSVKIAIEDIVLASTGYSLYGYVYCIHSILSAIDLKSIVNDVCWRDLLLEIVNMCFKLNTAVSQIVNSSSPEGHLPMDSDPDSTRIELCNFVIVTPQMVLLCSWRTVKEISLFFGYLTFNAPIFNESTKSGLLAEKQFKEIGNQLVTLLCETKHRGAFEQAHVGFSQLCSRLWHLKENEATLKKLPKTWLQQLLLAVVGLAPRNSKLCATRRSAGIPFMVQALVTSEIKKKMDTKKLIFHSVMRILLQLVNIEDDFNLKKAEDILFNESVFDDFEKAQSLDDLSKAENNSVKLNENTEIKTHALNILRALYRHCLLGDLVKEYIADGFIAAFKSYDGQSWAERNSATLLFSALVTRVFGVQRTKDHVNLTLHNRMTGKIFFEKFPSLLSFLLNELSTFVCENEDQIKPKIQCILLILTRLYPGVASNTAEEDWKIDQFIDLVSLCGKSRVYQTRELAARALVPLITEQNILPVSNNILKLIITYRIPINLLHGYLLQLLELIKSPHFLAIKLPEEDLNSFFKDFVLKVLHSQEFCITNDSPATYLIATNILEICLELMNMNAYNDVMHKEPFSEVMEKLLSHVTNNIILDKMPGIEIYESTATQVIITAINSEHYTGPLLNSEYANTQFWERVLNHKNPKVLTIVWLNLMNFIRKTNCLSLFELGYMTSIKVLDEPCEDPDLQDSIYSFIFSAIEEIEKESTFVQCNFSKNEEQVTAVNMCVHIFNTLSHQMNTNEFYPKGEFFKLIGKTYGFLVRNASNSEVQKDSKSTLYEAILKYSDMKANIDCRLGISEILFELYVDHSLKDDIHFMLNWWTTLFQLLYDDNGEVRLNAMLIVGKLLPETSLYCDTVVTNTFYAKFVSIMREENMEAILATFFCWSMTSASIDLEEMDETNAFNHSVNYECFEPLQITKICALHLQILVAKYNVTSTAISKPVKEWLRQRLRIANSKEFDSFTELIEKYKSIIPETGKQLNRILEPTYSAKLIREIAYMQIKSTVISGPTN